MSTSDPVYFHFASLKQRYEDALDNALHARLIDAQERTWLLSITRSSVTDDPDPVRVDRLTTNLVPLQPFELSASLLLSHTDVKTRRVFLFTLSHGIEAFNSRDLLRSVQCTRFAGGDVNAVFEAEKVEGDPFRAQMRGIIEQQVQQVGHLTDQLRLMPTLYDAATTAVARQLRERFPDTRIDPEVHLLQVVTVLNTGDDLFPVTQTLAQSTFDDCCRVRMTEGYERRFLDVQGRFANATDSALFSQALGDATNTVAQAYGDLLETFWDGHWSSGSTRRDLAVDTFSGSVRRELYRLGYDGNVGAETVQTLLQLLQSTSSDLSASNAWRCSLMRLKVGPSAHLPLAGTFVIQPRAGSDQSLFWFSPEHELMRFTNLGAFTTYLESIDGRKSLMPALALQDRWVLLDDGQWHLKLKEVRGSVVADCVDSVIAMQARNLLHAMGLSCAPEETMAMINDALDVRQVLDPRQLQFSAGRWHRALAFDFAEVWSSRETEDSSPLQASGSAALPSEGTPQIRPEPNSESDTGQTVDTTWVEYTQAFDDRVQRLRVLDTVLFDYAEQALQQYVCVLASGSVRARDVRVQWLESAPADPSEVETAAVPVSEAQQLVSMDLVSLLLECVSGHRSRVLKSGTRVLVDSVMTAEPIMVELIEDMLDRIVPGFIERYVQRFKASQNQYQRQGKMNLHPMRDALSLREEGIRLDLALAKRQAKIDSAAIDMARQVLERPTRALRTALGVPVTEAFSMSLSYGENAGVTLADSLLLRQPREEGGPLMLWQGATGWRLFSSIEQLQETLQRELHRPQAGQWLELLGTREREWLHAYLLKPSNNEVTVHLEQIDGHAIAALQQNILDRKQQDLRQLCLRAQRCRFEKNLFNRLANETESDGLLFDLFDALAIRVDNSIFEAMLPSWIASATVADLNLYYDILIRFYLATEGGKEFLFDIPSLRDYARQRLVDQLNKDFPSQALDVDHIKVTVRRYEAAIPTPGGLPSGVPAATIERSESLIDYAINRFVDMQDAALSVESPQQPEAARLLTLEHLRKLVVKLDVGAGYVALLRKALSPADPDYVMRKRLFVQQLPPSQLALALPEKVRGKISEQGYDFISNVFDTPDGVAREPVGEVEVILSPLQLVADKGMAADPVSGVYLICPAAPDTGPVLLYALHNSPFTFREYSDQTALLDDIRKDPSLQNLLLARLDPEVRERYALGGFVVPHLRSFTAVVGLGEMPIRTPGPVTLKLEKVTGNALDYLFNETVKLLVDLGTSNSVTNEQYDRAGRSLWMSLLVPLALPLLPAKLGLLVTLWQSRTLFSAAAAALWGRRWGEALAEFLAALGVLAGVREQAFEDEQVGAEAPPAIEESVRSPLDFSWNSSSLTPELRGRLRALEAQNVALAHMRHDALLNLYRNSSDGTPYVVVAGKVYQVKRLDDEGRWIIVGADGARGPRLTLDGNQRWQLDLRMGLAGGGGVISTVNSSLASFTAGQEMIVEASGMPQIRLLYRHRARIIGQAHLQAQRYMEICLDNLHALQPDAVLHPRVMQVVGDFFGTPSPDPALLARVESAIRSLLDALMDPSLSPVSSNRIVVGTNRSALNRTIAFVMPMDPGRRIFLTERFFYVQRYRLTPQAAAQGFDQSVHHRAATLIHELSHLVLDTKDIAYLEATAPYPDLLLDNTVANLRVRAQIERANDFGLTHQTNRSQLFTVEHNGTYRDLTREDRLGFRSVLKITGTHTLDEARRVFLSDTTRRSQVMLKNADSLTLLIMRLGRERLALPHP